MLKSPSRQVFSGPFFFTPINSLVRHCSQTGGIDHLDIVAPLCACLDEHNAFRLRSVLPLLYRHLRRNDDTDNNGS